MESISMNSITTAKVSTDQTQGVSKVNVDMKMKVPSNDVEKVESDMVTISKEGLEKLEAMKLEINNRTSEDVVSDKTMTTASKPPSARPSGAGKNETTEDTSSNVVKLNDQVANAVDLEVSDTDVSEDVSDDIGSLTETEIRELVASGDLTKSQMEQEFILRGITM